MLKTEEEARQSRCPMGDRCLGSQCMAWRWSEEVREIGTDSKCERCGGRGVIVTGHGESAGGEECPDCVVGYQVGLVPLGYCGLAGDPARTTEKQESPGHE